MLDKNGSTTVQLTIGVGRHVVRIASARDSNIVVVECARVMTFAFRPVPIANHWTCKAEAPVCIATSVEVVVPVARTSCA